jgi:protein-S-isoprenylcysteine O-methyltransferase Ste14
MPDLSASLARARVPLGFIGGVVVLFLAHPTWTALAAGLPIAALGEGVRVWAAGHLEKDREVTTSGPYRFTGHPLYLGSTLIGAGVAIACHSLGVIVITAVYLTATLGAAIRTEEAGLRAKFGREYADYRAGHSTGQVRRFSLARALRNREHRAVAGLVAVVFLLAVKAYLML